MRTGAGGDPELDDRALSYAELFNARGATTDVTREQVQLVRRADPRQRREVRLGPTAIGHRRRSVRHGRMYELLSDDVGAPVAVFRELEPAE